MTSVRLSVEDVLHQLEIQEGFEDEYCTNLDEESSDDDAPRSNFTTSNVQQMLIDCDVVNRERLHDVFPALKNRPSEICCYCWMKKY